MGLNPDEIPAWMAFPAAFILWGIWSGILWAEARERVRNMLKDDE